MVLFDACDERYLEDFRYKFVLLLYLQVISQNLITWNYGKIPASLYTVFYFIWTFYI